MISRHRCLETKIFLKRKTRNKQCGGDDFWITKTYPRSRPLNFSFIRLNKFVDRVRNWELTTSRGEYYVFEWNSSKSENKLNQNRRFQDHFRCQWILFKWLTIKKSTTWVSHTYVYESNLSEFRRRSRASLVEKINSAFYCYWFFFLHCRK